MFVKLHRNLFHKRKYHVFKIIILAYVVIYLDITMYLHLWDTLYDLFYYEDNFVRQDLESFFASENVCDKYNIYCALKNDA